MSTSTRSGGVGFCGALFILFLGLRLTDHIDWAWHWVAAPLWTPLAVMLACAVAAMLCFGVAGLYEFAQDRRSARERAKRGARRG